MSQNVYDCFKLESIIQFCLVILAFFHHQNRLREEMNLYRAYLAEQAKEEEKREKELDALITSEVEKQWAKRAEQWKREREARAKLMKDVLDTRKQQIKDKCKDNYTSQSHQANYMYMWAHMTVHMIFYNMYEFMDVSE